VNYQSPPASSTAIAPAVARVNWRGVALFLALTFGISWVLWLGLGALGVSFTIRTAIGMFGPAAAATLVRGPLCHEGCGDAGLRLVDKGHPRGGWLYAAA
jgi:CAAX protease family protein